MMYRNWSQQIDRSCGTVANPKGLVLGVHLTRPDIAVYCLFSYYSLSISLFFFSICQLQSYHDEITFLHVTGMLAAFGR